MEYEKQTPLTKLEFVLTLAKIIGLVLVLLALVIIVITITCFAIHIVSDTVQGLIILIVIAIAVMLLIMLEWSSLSIFRIGDYFNRRHVAYKLLRGYLGACLKWGQIYLIGMLGSFLAFMLFSYFLKNKGFTDEISMIIAGVPCGIALIISVIWAVKNEPITYSEYLKKNIVAFEQEED